MNGWNGAKSLYISKALWICSGGRAWRLSLMANGWLGLTSGAIHTCAPGLGCGVYRLIRSNHMFEKQKSRSKDTFRELYLSVD